MLYSRLAFSRLPPSGLSISLTGPSSPAGKQVLAGLEIWRDDVNAKGGLLGRPVQLVHYGHAFLTSV
jgi:ABC-type branched-subunit amino acid transport system substrate-binding protein